MRPTDKKFVQDLVERFCSPRPTEKASLWVENHVRLNEPKIKGRFTFQGRQSLRQIIDAWGPLTKNLAGGKEFVLVGGTGIGKTIGSVSGMAYRVRNNPTRALIVKPTAGHGPAGVKSFSKTRLTPCIRATMPELMPTGAARYDVSTCQLQINGSIIDLTGSNSVSQLGENRCDIVLQDELDKYPEQTEDSKEASPIYLADERTKNVLGARKYKYSTPTLPKVGIWSYFKITDMRRRLLPCPHCNPKASVHFKVNKIIGGKVPKLKGWIFLAWSKKFTVFPINGNEAFVKWADDSKDKHGNWDYVKVEKTAHYECPHCHGKIKFGHIPWMDDAAQKTDFEGWIKTAENPLPGEIGWHLPSLYSTSPDCSVGKLAVKFLKAKRSPEGVKGFINSDLAEPDMNQDLGVDKVGVVGKHIEVTGEWLKILSVDYHQNAPYFWYVVRAWNCSNKTHGIEFGNKNQWSDIDEIQKIHNIIPQAVIIDTGFDYYEVLKNCANIRMPSRCSLDEALQDSLPQCNGWNPAKAFGNKQLYRVENDDATLSYSPFRLNKNVDPYAGTEMAHKVRIELLEFKSDIFEDMMENIRNGETGLEWTISPEVDVEEYHNHMAGKKRTYSKKDPRVYKWETIRAGYADHVHSCELMNLVLAHRLQLISFEAVQSKKKKEER